MKKRRRQFWKKNGKKTYGQLNIKKIKSTNIILEKIITTKTKGKKNHAGKHCSNLQCFIKKSTVVILNQLNIKNNKIDKDNF